MVWGSKFRIDGPLILLSSALADLPAGEGFVPASGFTDDVDAPQPIVPCGGSFYGGSSDRERRDTGEGGDGVGDRRGCV